MPRYVNRIHFSPSESVMHALKTGIQALFLGHLFGHTLSDWSRHVFCGDSAIFYITFHTRHSSKHELSAFITIGFGPIVCLRFNTVCLQAATRSPLCSAMHRQWYSVWDAQLCCASQKEERLD